MPGVHLIMDVVAQHNLNDREAIRNWVNTVADRTRMVVLSETTLRLVSADYDSGPGVSCNVTIAESHITVHTWPESGRMSFDMYSCRPFDVLEVKGLLMESFGVTKVLREWTLDRAEMDPFRAKPMPVPEEVV